MEIGFRPNEEVGRSSSSTAPAAINDGSSSSAVMNQSESENENNVLFSNSSASSVLSSQINNMSNMSNQKNINKKSLRKLLASPACIFFAIIAVVNLLTQSVNAQSDVMRWKAPVVEETVFDSSIKDIQWAGPQQKTLLVHSSKDRLYRSQDTGFIWMDITDNLLALVPPESSRKKSKKKSTDQDKAGISRLVVHPADKSVVMAVGSDKRHFVSEDAGETWRLLNHNDKIHHLYFHPTRKNWAIITSWTEACDKVSGSTEPNSDGSDVCMHNAYVTKDLGKTKTLITSYVVQIAWGSDKNHQEDFIYFSYFRQKTGNQPKLTLWSKGVDFMLTEDQGQTKHRLVYKGNKFILSNKFIFVAKLKDSAAQTVNLMVSADGGKTFRPAELPEVLDEKSYTILDTSEDVVIMQVNHASTSRAGHIYISGADGRRFSRSLANNVRSASGECEFDRIAGLEGLYIANVKEKTNTRSVSIADDDDEDAGASKKKKKKPSKQEEVVRTVITFDKGGYWTNLEGTRC